MTGSAVATEPPFYPDVELVVAHRVLGCNCCADLREGVVVEPVVWSSAQVTSFSGDILSLLILLCSFSQTTQAIGERKYLP